MSQKTTVSEKILKLLNPLAWFSAICTVYAVWKLLGNSPIFGGISLVYWVVINFVLLLRAQRKIKLADECDKRILEQDRAEFFDTPNGYPDVDPLLRWLKNRFFHNTLWAVFYILSSLVISWIFLGFKELSIVLVIALVFYAAALTIKLMKTVFYPAN